ncbi:shikimate kinase [Geofilum sp. OHC36d9]|uniref:shikimate kinase n=1 Tax=Geofilum sp. OHC36d9 TaxID=3458413 RepID=UPI004033856D
MKIQRVFLIGFMGSGKSTVGQLLAKETGWKFLDLDHYIENQQNKTIAQIFKAHGEQEFRKKENEALKEIIQLEKVIIATGGGTPCYYNNMDIMNKNGLTIYLQLSPEELRKRLLPARAARPLIAGKSDAELLTFIKEKIAEREPFYQKAHAIADATSTGATAYLHIMKLYTGQIPEKES